MNIKIRVGAVELDAVLHDTPTAKKIVDALPFTCQFDTWGDEIYFTIPVELELENNAKEEVETGDLAYWPTGRAFCIFFGPTPMSTEGKIIPASAVNIIGKIQGDATRLKGVMGEQKVEILPDAR